jgi:hypothetical protein
MIAGMTAAHRHYSNFFSRGNGERRDGETAHSSEHIERAAGIVSDDGHQAGIIGLIWFDGV